MERLDARGLVIDIERALIDIEGQTRLWVDELIGLRVQVDKGCVASQTFLGVLQDLGIAGRNAGARADFVAEIHGRASLGVELAISDPEIGSRAGPPVETDLPGRVINVVGGFAVVEELVTGARNRLMAYSVNRPVSQRSTSSSSERSS